MKKFVIFLFIALSSSSAFSDIIRCRGDIGFWIPDKKPNQWKRIEMNPGSIFEDFGENVGFIRIGKVSRYPAADIFPFYGIDFKIKNKDLKIETDKQSWFTVHHGKNVLSCDVHPGTGD